MTAAYPLEMIREVDRRWRRRRENVSVRARVPVGQGPTVCFCPSCLARTPSAPLVTVFPRSGLVDHYWRCACGHEWIISDPSAK